MNPVSELAEALKLDVKFGTGQLTEAAATGNLGGFALRLRFLGNVRMWLWLPVSLDMGLRIAPQRLESPPSNFSDCYTVKSNEPARAGALCTRRVRRLLVDVRHAGVHVTDSAVRVDFDKLRPSCGLPLAEYTAARLETWVRRAARIAQAVEQARLLLPATDVVAPGSLRKARVGYR